jgi:hypothetical protein
MIRRVTTFLLLTALGVLASGCTDSNGPEASAKQSWYTALSGDTEDSLRNRLAHTQRDN